MWLDYWSCLDTTIRMRLTGTGGDPNEKGSPGRKLEKAREKILGKQLGLIAELRQHAAFVPFEFSFGGKFPRDTYNRIILTVQQLATPTPIPTTANVDFHLAWSITWRS